MHDIRRNALQARRDMGVENRDAASKIICEKVVRSSSFSAAKLVACYFPMSDEVDTRIIIERAWCANKRIFIPITRAKGKMFFREIRPDTTLVRNSLSIWEPVSGEIIAAPALQLVVAPLVAFDRCNHRIGMGGGYYDRAFSFLRHRKHWFKPKLFGVAFKCQEVEKITANPWDIRLYRTFSESD